MHVSRIACAHASVGPRRAAMSERASPRSGQATAARRDELSRTSKRPRVRVDPRTPSLLAAVGAKRYLSTAYLCACMHNIAAINVPTQNNITLAHAANRSSSPLMLSHSHYILAIYLLLNTSLRFSISPLTLERLCSIQYIPNAYSCSIERRADDISTSSSQVRMSGARGVASRGKRHVEGRSRDTGARPTPLSDSRSWRCS